MFFFFFLDFFLKKHNYSNTNRHETWYLDHFRSQSDKFRLVGYRDHIVTISVEIGVAQCGVGVSLHSKTYPLFIYVLMAHVHTFMHTSIKACFLCFFLQFCYTRVWYFNAGDLRLTRQVESILVNGAYIYRYRSMRVTFHSIDPLLVTLTCITTHGPATNVIWTRDSEEVEGGVTVLESGYNARYRHTLYNVTEGVYTCTVRNDKPSQVTAKVNLAGILRLMVYQCIQWCVCPIKLHLVHNMQDWSDITRNTLHIHYPLFW